MYVLTRVYISMYMYLYNIVIHKLFSIIIHVVMPAPQQLTVTRLTVEIRLQWQPVEGAVGYHVIYQFTGTTATTATESFPQTFLVLGASQLRSLESSYDFFVVAYDNDPYTLPSAYSEPVTIVPWPSE